MVIVMRVDYRWRRYTTALVLGSGCSWCPCGPGLASTSVRAGSPGSPASAVGFAKLAVLLFVADLLARRFDKVDNWRLTLQPVLVVFGVFAALLMLQPNLGTAIILASIVFVMLFVLGLSSGLAVQVTVAQSGNKGVVMMNHVGINVPSIPEAVTYYTDKTMKTSKIAAK
jgi:hypothetical protein